MEVKLTPRWKQVLFAVFAPKFWYTNYKFSPILDRLIQEAIARNEIFHDGTSHVNDDRMPFNVIIRGVGMAWIQNYPYAYGAVEGVMPSRHTVYLLRKHVEKVIPKKPFGFEEQK